MSLAVNHYKVLGVSADSEDVVIQAAYDALLSRYEAAEQNAETVKRLQEIKVAHAFLSDPVIRRNYDAARLKAGHDDFDDDDAAEAEETPEPEPAPVLGTSGYRYSAAEQNDKKGSWVFGVLAIIAVVVIANNMGDDSSSNTLNVDETLTTENVVAEDYEAAANALEAAANMVDAVPTLASVPEQAVEFGDIESAAKRFASIMLSTGLNGAREYSVDCHKKVVESPSWSGADHCAAFDFAAASVDQALSRQGTWALDSYFQFHSSNQENHYVSAGAPKYSVTGRLNSIRSAAGQAADEAMRAAVAASRARQEPVVEEDPDEEFSQPPDPLAPTQDANIQGE